MITDKSQKYSDLSIELTKKINKKEKKEQGIFFTPSETIDKSLLYLEPYFKDIKRVLEPSCGSCEYVNKLNSLPYEFNITAMELNKLIFESIEKYQSSQNNLVNDNFITYNFEETYDLIIGNPPYFVMKKNEVDSSYYEYFDGRPNIFILFIIKSLKLLAQGGIVSFVLPKNFLNSLYYDKTRKYILQNFNILNIINCVEDKYLDTQQDTIILIVRNEPHENNNLFSLEISGYTIFGFQNNIEKIKTLYQNSKTLSELGFEVNVGNVVWNQCKNQLTEDSSKTTLIYSSDIKDNKLSIKKYPNKAKKNYIDKDGDTSPVLVINRGYGVGSYNFNYCIINENEERKYLVENHLICIRDSDTTDKNTLIDRYKKIIESFKNEKTKEFISLYFGNNAINTTELCKILPIYDI